MKFAVGKRDIARIGLDEVQQRDLDQRDGGGAERLALVGDLNLDGISVALYHYVVTSVALTAPVSSSMVYSPL